MKNFKVIAAFIVVLMFGYFYITRTKSQVKYADISCPKCASTEVLDYGYDEENDGNHLYCSDCKSQFYILRDK